MTQTLGQISGEPPEVTVPELPSLAKGVRYEGMNSALGGNYQGPSETEDWSATMNPEQKRRAALDFARERIETRTGLSVSDDDVINMLQTGRLEITQSIMTLAAQQQRFDQQLKRRQQWAADRKARADEYAAAGIGLITITPANLGIDPSTYMDASGNITDMAKYNAARALVAGRLKTLDPRNQDAPDLYIDKLTRGETLTDLAVSTTDGSMVGVNQAQANTAAARVYGFDRQETYVDPADGLTKTRTVHVYGDNEVAKLLQDDDQDFQLKMTQGYDWVDANGDVHHLRGRDEIFDQTFKNSEMVRNGYTEFTYETDPRTGEQILKVDKDGNPIVRYIEGTQSAATRLEERALELKERGMNLDEAYRQATIEMEEKKAFGYFQARASYFADSGVDGDAWVQRLSAGSKEQLGRLEVLTSDGKLDVSKLRNLSATQKSSLAGVARDLVATLSGEDKMGILAKSGNMLTEANVLGWLAGDAIATLDDKGNIRVVEVYGTAGAEDRANAAALARDQLGYTHEEEMAKNERIFREKQRTGYWGEHGWVRGTEGFAADMARLTNELGMTADSARQYLADQSRVGYDRTVEVIGPNGAKSYHTVHITGTEEFASTQAQSAWQREENTRNGYTDENGHYVKGSTQSAQDVQTALQDNQAEIDYRAEHGWDEWIQNPSTGVKVLVHRKGRAEEERDTLTLRSTLEGDAAEVDRQWNEMVRNGYMGEDGKWVYGTDQVVERTRIGYDMWVQKVDVNGNPIAGAFEKVHVTGTQELDDHYKNLEHSLRLKDQHMRQVAEFGGFVTNELGEEVWRDGTYEHQVEMAEMAERFNVAGWNRQQADQMAQFVRSQATKDTTLIQQSYIEGRRTYWQQTLGEDATDDEIEAKVQADWDAVKDTFTGQSLQEKLEQVRLDAELARMDAQQQAQNMAAAIQAIASLGGDVLRQVIQSSGWSLFGSGGSDQFNEANLRKLFPFLSQAEAKAAAAAYTSRPGAAVAEAAADAVDAGDVLADFWYGPDAVIPDAAPDDTNTPLEPLIGAAGGAAANFGTGFTSVFSALTPSGATLGVFAGAAAVAALAYTGYSIWDAFKTENKQEKANDKKWRSMMDSFSYADAQAFDAIVDENDGVSDGDVVAVMGAYDEYKEQGGRRTLTEWWDSLWNVKSRLRGGSAGYQAQTVEMGTVRIVGGSGDTIHINGQEVKRNAAGVVERIIDPARAQTSFADTSAIYRRLIDQGALAKDAGDMLVANQKDILELWLRLPGNMRSTDVSANRIAGLLRDSATPDAGADFATILDDVKLYGADMGMMSSQQLFAALKQLDDAGYLDGTAQITGDARTSINLLYSQLGAYISPLTGGTPQIPGTEAFTGKLEEDLQVRRSQLNGFYSMLNVANGDTAGQYNLGYLNPFLGKATTPADLANTPALGWRKAS